MKYLNRYLYLSEIIEEEELLIMSWTFYNIVIPC